MGNGVNKIRAIAFYLPQYHPVAENDEWWGKGFTEWTNVAKAKPLFKNHYQPHFPADLGFYDLRLPDTRQAQADLARHYEIEGFCYWHYWFGNGKTILERPISEILKLGEPDFPFCLAWANESWTGIWHGLPRKILAEQLYPGEADYIAHFNYLLTAFKDTRYIQVEGKPLFYIYSPDKIPDILEFTNLFRKLAAENGLKGLYIIGNSADENWDPLKHGCDAVNLSLLGSLYKHLPSHKNILYRRYRNQLLKPTWSTIYKRIFKKPTLVYKYESAIKYLIGKKETRFDSYPCVIPNWDNTPRLGINGLVLKNSTPKAFEKHLTDAVATIEDKPEQKKIIFIKSWNEWAEGNHLEPDLRFGHQYLEVTRKVLCKE